MDRISDEQLENFTSLFHKIMDEGGVKRPDLLWPILQELKERRAADKPLDIKDQLRLVCDRCPDVWDTLNSTAKALNYALEALGGGKNE